MPVRNEKRLKGHFTYHSHGTMAGGEVVGGGKVVGGEEVFDGGPETRKGKKSVFRNTN